MLTSPVSQSLGALPCGPGGSAPFATWGLVHGRATTMARLLPHRLPVLRVVVARLPGRASRIVERMHQPGRADEFRGPLPIRGALPHSFQFCRSLREPFARALVIMFLFKWWVMAIAGWRAK